ncbi:MAG: hypothetical protein ACYCWW_19245 [Deltaproteobacteria bacterium]
MTTRRHLWLALIFAGCASVPKGPPEAPLSVGHGAILVEGRDDDDPAELRLVAQAAERALPALERFGDPPAVVHIVLVPTHAALEQATHRYGYRWLRAWSRYDIVLVQDPRTWGLFLGTETQIARLLTHELTHCAMFQAAGSAQGWSHKAIPLWFREGMASVVAGEEGRRWSEKEVGATLRDEPLLLPLTQGDELQREDPALVYSAAHWAYLYFERRFGQKAVPELLARLRGGDIWPDAFEAITHESERAFERQYVQELTGLR